VPFPLLYLGWARGVSGRLLLVRRLGLAQRGLPRVVTPHRGHRLGRAVRQPSLERTRRDGDLLRQAQTGTCCARRRLGLAAPGADWTVAIDQVLSSGCFAGSFRRSRVETAPRLVVRGEGRCWEAAPRSVVGERGALEEKRSVYCQRVHASVAGLQPRSRQPPRSGRNDQPGARIYPRSTGLENAGADAAASSAARKKPTWQNTLRRSATSAYSTPNLSGPPEVLCVQSPDESDQRRIVRDFRKKASGDF